MALWQQGELLLLQQMLASRMLRRKPPVELLAMQQLRGSRTGTPHLRGTPRHERLMLRVSELQAKLGKLV